MMGINYCIFVLLVIAFLMHNAPTAARNLCISTDNDTNSSVLDLATRLQASSTNDTNTTDCWTALSNLRTCSNEIVGFFLNGYTEIDAPCCDAIEVIVHHCLPSMLSVLGYSVEEGNLLAAYCSKISATLESKSTNDIHG